MSEKLTNFAMRRNDNDLKMASPTIGRFAHGKELVKKHTAIAETL